MGDMLSQAEIDALLGSTVPDGSDENESENIGLTIEEIDALGEIGNISMGTSATTLFTLLNQRVTITTPSVSVTSWGEMAKEYPMPYVAVKVEYTDGLSGSNFLILKESDAKIITDLMMGGEGVPGEGELTYLHLSAISEAMNQMIGSSATSMSSMFNKRIEISPPKSFLMRFDSPETYVDEMMTSQTLVKVSFKMIIGNLIDSEIMQIVPIEFAKDMVLNLFRKNLSSQVKNNNIQTTPAPPEKPISQIVQNTHDIQSEISIARNLMNEAAPQQTPFNGENIKQNGSINVQPAQFQAFDDSRMLFEKKNINMIMDVPLVVTVELGRTQKVIKDILEFGPGSIIELDKLAGEPVDILINGKSIAKGEVVVIDESFGVRITDIIHPSKRIK